MTRAEATDLIRAHGGEFVASVNRRTCFLVVGQESWPLQKDGRLTRRLRQAHELQHAGSSLTILAEDELLNRLGAHLGADGVQRRYTLAQLVELLDVPRTRVRA